MTLFRTLFFAGIAGTLTAVSPALGATEAPAITTSVSDQWNRLRAGHPRLLWTAEAQASGEKSLASDPLHAEFRAVVLRVAGELLTAPVANRVPEDEKMLLESRKALGLILTEAYAWRITGDARYRERALREMRVVCAFPDWNPRHFLDTAEMGFAVAIGYDWLYPTLTPEDRALFRTALAEKALKPAMAVYRSKSGWHQRNNNWNQVCNGGLIAAALAVAESEPELSKAVVAAAVASLPKAVRQYEPDGGYQEGPVYWQYGTTYDVIALNLLRGALGTDFGLSDEPAFRRTGGYYLRARGPSGNFFNYSDCWETAGPTPAYAWLANEYGPGPVRANARAEFAAYLRDLKFETYQCGRFLALYGIWFPAGVSGDADAAPLDARFRGNADIAMLRGSWTDPDAAYVGFKAGRVDVSHSHMDLGSFVFDTLGERWVCDLGPDDYNLPGYWDSSGGRWKLFRLGNQGHGTLIPEGARMNPKGSAAITRLESSPDHAVVVADLTKAYAGEFTRWERGIRLDRTRRSILVRDEITGAKPGVKLEWAVFTKARVEVDPADATRATLTQNGKILHARILAPAGFVFSATPLPEPVPPARSNRSFTRLVATGTLPGVSGAIVVSLSPLETSPGVEISGASLSDWK